MAIVTIGIALNTTAIALNQGMPYKVRGDEEPVVSVKHRPERDGDVLTVLDDRIYIPGPLSESVSFGDLILAVGIVDVVYRASRRPRRSSRAGAAHADHPPEAVSTWRRPLPTPARPEGAEEPAPAGEAARASAGEAARASAGEAERASAGEGANASWNVRPAPAEPERAGEPVPEGAEEPVLDLVAAEGFPGLGNAAARDRRWPLRAPWYSHHPTLRRLEPPPAPPDGSESPDGSPSYGAVLRSLRGDADPGVDPGRAFEHALERGEDAGIVDVPRS
jgi:hypothetical protein